MSAPLQVDPEKVIGRLSQQVGQLAAQLAMQETALEAAHARIADLEAAASEEDQG